MIPPDLDAWLARSLEDRRLSRNERQALAPMLEPGVDREAVRARAFEVAGEALPSPADRDVLGWLEDVTRALRDPASATRPARAESHFSPGEDCPRAILRLVEGARSTLDVCVFTITDDRLADAILGAARRGVAVRVVTDDAKAEDLGSDVDRLGRAGVPVRVDRSPFHMHHKFAIVDAATLLTGSYNWTRGAARDNEENLIVTDDPRLVAPFAATFARLWDRLA